MIELEPGARGAGVHLTELPLPALRAEDLQLAAAALVSLRGHRTDDAEKTLLRLL